MDRSLLVAEPTRRLAGTEADDLVRVGELPVRGRTAPVELWGLDAEEGLS
jgi:class 3 adenylate cyclase